MACLECLSCSDEEDCFGFEALLAIPSSSCLRFFRQSKARLGFKTPQARSRHFGSSIESARSAFVKLIPINSTLLNLFVHTMNERSILKLFMPSQAMDVPSDHSSDMLERTQHKLNIQYNSIPREIHIKIRFFQGYLQNLLSIHPHNSTFHSPATPVFRPRLISYQ